MGAGGCVIRAGAGVAARVGAGVGATVAAVVGCGVADVREAVGVVEVSLLAFSSEEQAPASNVRARMAATVSTGVLSIECVS